MKKQWIDWTPYDDLTITISEEAAKNLVKTFHQVFPELAAVWKDLERSIDEEQEDAQ